MSAVAQLREQDESIETVDMSTDELLANAQAAMRWRDEAGDSSVEIYAENLALRFWEALNERLLCGDPTPVAWLPSIASWIGQQR